MLVNSIPPRPTVLVHHRFWLTLALPPAIVGTLKAAKKRGFIDFKGQMLLKGMSDDVDVVLVNETLPENE